jgi:hypothetical protein
MSPVTATCGPPSIDTPVSAESFSSPEALSLRSPPAVISMSPSLLS